MKCTYDNDEFKKSSLIEWIMIDLFEFISFWLNLKNCYGNETVNKWLERFCLLYQPRVQNRSKYDSIVPHFLYQLNEDNSLVEAEPKES